MGYVAALAGFRLTDAAISVAAIVIAGSGELVWLVAVWAGTRNTPGRGSPARHPSSSNRALDAGSATSLEQPGAVHRQ